MTGTCGTCKHWTLIYEGAPRGVCEAIPHHLGAPDSALAVAADSDDYNAQLETRAEFGCVLHEPKT